MPSSASRRHAWFFCRSRLAFPKHTLYRMVIQDAGDLLTNTGFWAVLVLILTESAVSRVDQRDRIKCGPTFTRSPLDAATTAFRGARPSRPTATAKDRAGLSGIEHLRTRTNCSTSFVRCFLLLRRLTRSLDLVHRCAGRLENCVESPERVKNPGNVSIMGIKS